MQDTHHDGGKSILSVLASIILKTLSIISASTVTDILTIAMLVLAITYHCMGIVERWHNYIKRKHPKP